MIKAKSDNWRSILPIGDRFQFPTPRKSQMTSYVRNDNKQSAGLPACQDVELSNA